LTALAADALEQEVFVTLPSSQTVSRRTSWPAPDGEAARVTTRPGPNGRTPTGGLRGDP